jgi:hypothetical protein
MIHQRSHRSLRDGKRDLQEESLNKLGFFILEESSNEDLMTVF